jgi:hypothetical protein
VLGRGLTFVSDRTIIIDKTPISIRDLLLGSESRVSD